MDNDAYLEACLKIDDLACEVSDYEASFLESMLLHCPPALTDKQQAVIRSMARRYLGEEL